MKFFKLVDGVLELDRDEIRLYPAINKIITRDKGGKIVGDPDGRRKLFAYKEFAYVYYRCDFYAYPIQNGLTNSAAHKWTVKTLELPSDYSPDEVVLELMNQYTKEHLSVTKRTIKNIIIVFAMTNDILEKVQPSITSLLNMPNITLDQVNELINIQKTLMAIATTIPEQAKKLREAMTLLEEEEKAIRVGRGGKTIDDSQNPDNDIDKG